MRPAALPSLLLLAAMPTLPAQGTPLATSAGILLQTGPLIAGSVAPGLDVTNGVSLGASGSFGAAQFQALTMTTSTAIDLDWNVSCSAFGSTTASSQGAIRYELAAAPQVTGQIVATWIPAQTGTGAASCSIDLLDDGIIDATGSVTWPLTFGSGVVPLRVRVATTAHAGVVYGPWGSQWTYQGTAYGTLHIRIEPTHCQSAVFGSGCADPQLTVLGNFAGGADLLGTFAPAADLGVAVLGFDQHATQLPLAPGCTLLTTPNVVLWSAISASHTAAWSLAVPAAARPLAFAAQLVGIDVDTVTATTSAGFWITCQ